VTHYGLEGPGFKIPWGEIFPNHADWPQGSPSLLYNGYQVYFPWVKQSGHGADHSPSSGFEVEERVELYLYPPSVPSWHVVG